jgi:hypothetical protein
MLVGVVNSIPTTAPETLLNLSTSASFTAAGLLLLLMFFEVNWTKEHAWITAGVLSVLASDFITSWRSTAPLSVISVSVIQLAPIPGLILLSLAGSSKLKD